ncbi:MAG: hypothetical protein ACLSAH_03150 [Bilophila wadsworthia]
MLERYIRWRSVYTFGTGVGVETSSPSTCKRISEDSLRRIPNVRVLPLRHQFILLAVDVAPALTHTLRRLGRDGMKRKVTTQPGDLENNFHVSSRA